MIAHDRAHHLVRMQRALHDRLRRAGAHEIDRPLRRRMRVRRVLDDDARQRQAGRFRRRLDLAARSDQNRLDHVEIARLDCAGERGGVAGMHDRGSDRRQVARARRQRREAGKFAEGEPAGVGRHVHLRSGLRLPEYTSNASTQ